MLDKIKNGADAAIDVGIKLISLSIVLQIIFGSKVAFLTGNVIGSILDIVWTLGNAGLTKTSPRSCHNERHDRPSVKKQVINYFSRHSRFGFAIWMDWWLNQKIISTPLTIRKVRSRS